MNGVVFSILAMMLLALQTTVAPRVAIYGARPDLLFVLVVFLGLYARPQQAVIAACAVGLAADLLTLERFGLLAATYGLAVVLVVTIREFLFRYRSTTQFFMTFGAAVLANSAWLIYRSAAFGLPGDGLIRGAVIHLFLPSLYTAAFAPILHGGLLSAGRLFGIRKPRYRFRPAP